MAITAKEIAVLAGVSRGTVDRALKGRSGISAETKERILEIAEKHHYKPNLIGKALVYSGKSIQVQVVLNSIGNPFFDDVKAGIFAAADEFSDYGFQIVLSEFKGYHADELLRILNSLPDDMGQLIVTPISDSTVEKKLNQLSERGVELILLSGELENVKNAVYVGCDYLKSGMLAGRLTGLLSQGRANLFIVTGSIHHIGHAQRVDGIVKLIKNDYPDIHLRGFLENNDDDALAYAEMRSALQKHPEIDFIYITAGGVNGTLRAVREISPSARVCAFDDTPVIREALKSGSVLATICQQPYEQGYQSVKVLFDKIVAKNRVNEKIYSELYIKVDQSL